MGLRIFGWRRLLVMVRVGRHFRPVLGLKVPLMDSLASLLPQPLWQVVVDFKKFTPYLVYYSLTYPSSILFLEEI